jgi:hypothetical protein
MYYNSRIIYIMGDTPIEQKIDGLSSVLPRIDADDLEIGRWYYVEFAVEPNTRPAISGKLVGKYLGKSGVIPQKGNREKIELFPDQSVPLDANLQNFLKFELYPVENARIPSGLLEIDGDTGLEKPDIIDFSYSYTVPSIVNFYPKESIEDIRKRGLDKQGFFHSLRKLVGNETSVNLTREMLAIVCSTFRQMPLPTARRAQSPRKADYIAAGIAATGEIRGRQRAFDASGEIAPNGSNVRLGIYCCIIYI